MTPHEALGVPDGASQEEVKAAWRRLPMQYHPDRNPGDEAAAERMKEVNAAAEAILKAATSGSLGSAWRSRGRERVLKWFERAAKPADRLVMVKL